MGKGKHTGQKIHENPDLENSIPSTWDSNYLLLEVSVAISILNSQSLLKNSNPCNSTHQTAVNTFTNLPIQ